MNTEVPFRGTSNYSIKNIHSLRTFELRHATASQAELDTKSYREDIALRNNNVIDQDIARCPINQNKLWLHDFVNYCAQYNKKQNTQNRERVVL